MVINSPSASYSLGGGGGSRGYKVVLKQLFHVKDWGVILFLPGKEIQQAGRAMANQKPLTKEQPYHGEKLVYLFPKCKVITILSVGNIEIFCEVLMIL